MIYLLSTLQVGNKDYPKCTNCLMDMLKTLSIISNLTREDSRFYPKFTRQRQKFYNDKQQKDNNRKSDRQFMKIQPNYFDQYIPQPSRYDPLFRRKINSYLNPNGDHRSIQSEYYNQRINDPRRWGRKKPPKRKKKHFDEYLQSKMYSIDSHFTVARHNNFPSVVNLDEKEISHQDYSRT